LQSPDLIQGGIGVGDGCFDRKLDGICGGLEIGQADDGIEIGRLLLETGEGAVLRRQGWRRFVLRAAAGQDRCRKPQLTSFDGRICRTT